MDDNEFEAWLETLTPELREKAIEFRNAFPAEADKMLEAARQAAGLPKEAPKKAKGAVDTARKAAGLDD
jgi:hypothetical protein